MLPDLNLLTHYLARRDLPALDLSILGAPADFVIVPGSSLLDPLLVAVDAIEKGCARQILVSGGIGHATDALRGAVEQHPYYHSVPTVGRAEADIYHGILVKHLGIDPTRVLVENRSTNCGANAIESKRLLDQQEGTISTLLLIQDPTMQRRTHASFARAWQDSPEVTLLSLAPFIPLVQEDSVISDSREVVWPIEKMISLVLGEIVRLRDNEQGYGPRGHNFIDHMDIPQEILSAFERVSCSVAETPRRAL